MASWTELEWVRKDPATFRGLAKRLMDDPYCEDSEFADGFLENIANWKRDKITLRQAEVLLGRATTRKSIPTTRASAFGF
jgi:hypothetical protein